jgi:hypothetical protein
VGGEHLGDIAQLARPGVTQQPSRGDVARLAVASRQRSVGDRPQQRLQEGVLAALGRAGIVVAREELLGHEPVQQRARLLLAPIAQRRHRGGGERLAEDRGVL